MSLPRAAALALGALLAAAPANARAETWLFTYGLLCNDPKDVAEVVDAPVVRLRILQKVLSGACLSNGTLPPRRISPPETRTSPGGKRFVCFREAASEKAEEFHNFGCAPEGSVTSLSAELARRTGEYEVLQHDTTGASEVVKVICREGGTLTLARPAGRARYVRMPFVFMAVALAREPFAEVDGDLETAMRQGCKGADYRRP